MFLLFCVGSSALHFGIVTSASDFLRVRTTMLRRLLRGAAWTSGGAAVTAAASAGYLHYQYGPDMLPRMVRLYADAIPATYDYKTLQFAKKHAPWAVGKLTSATDYEELHEKWAPRMLAATFELRGFFLKGAQLAASNYGGAIPRTWQKAFEPVLDKQPHMPWAEAREVLAAQLRRPIGDVFESVEEEPFAAASIGQVHRAVLRPDAPGASDVPGRRVVIKLMYPDVEGRFRGDVALTRAFYAAVMPEQVTVLDEIERQFANEFDYTHEAAQMERVRVSLLASGIFPDVIVPAPVLPLCSKGMLVMEEIVGGVKLTTALEDDLAALAASQGRSVAEVIAGEERANAEALAHGVLRSGPDAQAMSRAIAAIRARNFLARAVGAAPLHVPLNHAWLVDELLRVHGHQVLVDGAFNGDPHPGNLLVIRDADGAFKKLALVDFGQLKVWTEAQRLAMARATVALARADPANPSHRSVVASLSKDMGMLTERGDVDVLFDLSVLSFDRDDALFTKGVEPQTLLQELSARDRIITFPQDFILASRASFMLRGLGHMLNQHRSVARAWAPQAEAALRGTGIDPDSVLPSVPQAVPANNLSSTSLAAAAASAALGSPAPASTIAADPSPPPTATDAKAGKR